MIRRIIALKDVGRFADLRSASGNEGEFAKVNVIYAPNACGKTTLCDVFRSLGTQNPSYIVGRTRIGGSSVPAIDILVDTNTHWAFRNGQWTGVSACPSLYVYDQRFVKDNVFVGGQIGVEQKRNVYSLALGQKAIELNKAVQDAGNELTKATELVSRCESILSALLPPGQQIEVFRRLEKIDGVDDKIAELTERIARDKNKKSKAEQIRKHGLLQKIAIPTVSKNDLENVMSTTLNDAALTAESKIKEHLTRCVSPQKLSIDWVRQGYEAQEGELCPYCGQDMALVDLLDTYKAFFSGTLKQQEKQRNDVKAAFQESLGVQAQNGIVNVVKQNSLDCDWWNDACGLSVALPSLNADNTKETYSKALGIVLLSIERKVGSLTTAISLENDEGMALDEIADVVSSIQSYNAAVDNANEKIQDFQKSVESINIDELTKNLADLEYRKKRFEENVVGAYKNYDDAVDAKRSAQSAKTRANDALKEESKSIFDSFGQKINEILSSFGVNFTVVNEGVNLRGGTATGQLSVKINAGGSSATIDSSSDAADDPTQMSLSNTLSGGDCSALGLAFFLAKLDTDTNLSSSIVVIDDPYHDQDRSRQSQTILLLKRKANECSQLFLLSHNIEFAQMFMSDKGIARNEIRAFEIPQLGSSMELKHGDLPQLPSKSYETDYAELSGYVSQPERYADRLKEVVGRIRPLLETYLRYKYPLRWGEKDWLGDMIGKIKAAQPNDIIDACKCLLRELEDINSYTQRFHHRVTGVSADVPDPIELGTYVKRTLTVVHHA